MKKLKHFTLTSKAGRFEFATDVRLSHAKLIRDTITASVMGSCPSAPRIKTDKPQFAARWIRENLQGPIATAQIAFDWIPA